MKLVAIGDIHGRSIWKDILEKEKDADKVIFIGDYFDSFDIGVKKQVKNFIEILEEKEKNPDKIILLLGNHDYHYLPEVVRSGNTGSGFSSTLYNRIGRRVVNSIRSGIIQGCYIHNHKILFSHAGITKTWSTNNNLKLDTLQDSVNGLLKRDRSKFGFYHFNPNDTSMSVSDPYGDNAYQSPIWVRPTSLYRDIMEEYTYVIGHTRTRSGKVETFNNIYFIDCLSDTGQYLVIENEIFKPTDL